ncbi:MULTISPECIES: hypothetical protein [Streptomyces]|uniref:Integral membrane protein n=1 Tax=Streptomyces solicathayae TaxID=3081768 RepID=A0ABZ0M331_9ACTN|nr:hypothetical protein [Streptomyces sp. HUAS YS2]WOX26186.1 hypothetical protein R2D22_34310 [Streptomyces sp. HUAS YS2]
MTADSAGDHLLARSLLREILADPQSLPEILALFAVRRLGPVARRKVAALPADEPAELRARVVTRGTRAAVTEGAFVGGPFMVLVPVAFCAALLRQTRTMLELAALDGRDPRTRERAAELLVIQGVHDDVEQAGAALDAREGTRKDDPAEVHRHGFAALWNLVPRMARLLGVITPGQELGAHPRLVQAGRWLLLVAVILTGLVAPLVWLPYMAMSYRRGTADLMRRATLFYFAEPVSAPRRRSRLSPGAVAGAARVGLSILLPVLMITGVLAADLRLAGSHWPVLGIVLTVGSLVVGAAWLRWHKRRDEEE